MKLPTQDQLACDLLGIFATTVKATGVKLTKVGPGYVLKRVSVEGADFVVPADLYSFGLNEALSMAARILERGL